MNYGIHGSTSHSLGHVKLTHVGLNTDQGYFYFCKPMRFLVKVSHNNSVTIYTEQLPSVQSWRPR